MKIIQNNVRTRVRFSAVKTEGAIYNKMTLKQRRECIVYQLLLYCRYVNIGILGLLDDLANCHTIHGS